MAPDEISIRNQTALEELAQTLEWSTGEFHLFLARCNYVGLRSRLIQQLQTLCPIRLQVVTPTPHQTIYEAIAAQMAAAEAPDAVIVTGLENLANLPEALSAADTNREEFRAFALPVVLWLDDDQFQTFKSQAPNFESWAAVDVPRFSITTAEVLDSLNQGVAAVLTAAYDPNQRKISTAVRAVTQFGHLRRRELPRALQVLRDRQVALPLDLEANLHLVQGIDVAEAVQRRASVENGHQVALGHLQGAIAYWRAAEEVPSGMGFVSSPVPRGVQEAIAHFLRCIEHWRGRLTGRDGGDDAGANGHLPLQDGGPSDDHGPQTGDPLPVALFYLGRHWFEHVDQRRRVGAPDYTQADWQQARSPLEECLLRFDAAGQDYMAAKVMWRLQKTLRRLEDWDALEAQSRRATALHQRYPTPDWLAADHSFLARSAIARQDWPTAKTQAQTALEILAPLPKENQWPEGLYRRLLAEAEVGLGNTAAAIAQLETARDLGDRGHPTTYCKVLSQLRELYWQQGRYLEAFKLKQARLEVEKVAGIRAFVGAGRLGAALVEETEDEVAPEIWASGRQRDLERIVARVADNTAKLTVVHGASGVGKSSLINAGVVPALEQRVMGTQRNRVVVLRRYGNWVGELEEQLRLAGPLNPPSRGDFESGSVLDRALSGLQQWSDQDQRIILIFDQFEEFFFANPDPRSRRQFFQFLADALQIPFMNVILSLREDYIHYLLDANRLAGMSAIGHDILGRNVLYRLGNFPPEDATKVVEDLTGRSRTHFEPALVAALVADLAREFEEVRPIELQVVGSQLETAGIGTKAQYEELGEEPKEALVGQYLSGVVVDCGPGNAALAELLLFLLTDGRGTRPLKTRSELRREVAAFPAEVRGGEPATDTLDDDLDLALRILSGSGVVMYLPEEPEPRYQLVHDYIAETVRARKAPQMEVLMARLAEEQEKRSLAEERERLAAAALITVEEQKRLTVEELEEAREKNQAADRRIAVGVRVLALSVLGVLTAVSIARSAIDRAGKAEREIVAASVEVETAQGELTALRKRLRRADVRAKEKEAAVAAAQANLERLNAENTDSKAEIAAAKAQLIWAQQGLLAARQDASVAGRQAELLRAEANMVRVQVAQARKNLTIAKAGTTLEQQGVNLYRQFERLIEPSAKAGQLELLLTAIYQGKTLLSLIDVDTELADYPALSPMFNLQQILHHVQEKNNFDRDKAVTSVSFSSDGASILTGALDGKVTLRSQSGEQLQQFQHDNAVHSVSFSPDGNLIITGSGNRSESTGKATLWDLSGERLQQFPHDGLVTSASFHPDGDLIITGAESGKVTLWSRNGEKIQELHHEDVVYSVSLSPDGDSILTGSGDDLGSTGQATLWSKHGNLVRQISHDKAVFSASFSSDGNSILTGSGDSIGRIGEVNLWTLEGGNLQQFQQDSAIYSADLSPDSDFILTGSHIGGATLWRRSREQSQRFQHENAVFSVNFNRDGSLILTGSGDPYETTGGYATLWSRSGE